MMRGEEGAVREKLMVLLVVLGVELESLTVAPKLKLPDTVGVP